MARRARFCRTTKTRIWGRERPPKTGRGTVIGGRQRGSLTPQMPRHCCLRPRSQDTGGEKRRPSDRGPNSLIAKNIAGSTRLAISSSCAPPSLPISAAKRGTTTPRPVVPPPFLDAEFVNRLPGEGNLASLVAVVRFPTNGAKAAFGRASQLRQSTGAHLARWSLGALRVR